MCGLLGLPAVHEHCPAPRQAQMNFRQFARRAELCYEAEIRRIIPKSGSVFGQDDASET
jgi:hypothetical protein